MSYWQKRTGKNNCHPEGRNKVEESRKRLDYYFLLSYPLVFPLWRNAAPTKAVSWQYKNCPRNLVVVSWQQQEG